MFSEFSVIILDALPYQAALLDTSGQILHVNRQWTAFCRANGGSEASCGAGINYLQVCRSACPGEDHALPHLAASGIADVLQGRCAEFSLDYPCDDGARQRRWFRLRAMCLPGNATGACCLVLHEDLGTQQTALASAKQPDPEAVPAGGKVQGTGARVAHELRSPLTTVLGMAELALFDARQPLPVEQRLRLQRIQTAGEAMVALLDKLAVQPRFEAEVSRA